MRRRRRLGFLEGALAISLAAHAIFLVGLRLATRERARGAQMMKLTRVTCLEIDPRSLRRYRETTVAAAPVARPVAHVEEPAGPPVTYATPAPTIQWLRRPLRRVPRKHRRVPRKPRPRRSAPPPHRVALAPRPAPTPKAHPTATPAPRPADAPAPSPSPRPLLAAIPTPSPPPAASPAPAPAPSPAASPAPAPSPAASPAPAPSPAAAVVVPDPSANFTVVLAYHNDGRLQRDRHGYVVLDVTAISQMGNVKPVLTAQAKGGIPPAQAADYGLRPLDEVQAQVEVDIDAPHGMLTGPVQPGNVVLDAMHLIGRPLPSIFQDKLARFIQDQVAGTQWLPASDFGNFLEHSRQVFTVTLVQTRDASVARLPSRPVPAPELR